MKIDCLLWIANTLAQRLEMAGITCPECGNPIEPGQRIEWDHRHAVVFDGPHEYQNLRPIHYDPCHKKKTARDVKANAKVKRLQQGGRKRRGKQLQSRPFQKGVKKPWPKRKLANSNFRGER